MLLLAAAQMLAVPLLAALLLLLLLAPAGLPVLLPPILPAPLLLLRVMPNPCHVGPVLALCAAAALLLTGPPAHGKLPSSLPSLLAAFAAAAAVPRAPKLANTRCPSVLVRKLRSTILTWPAIRSNTQGSGVACTAARAHSSLPMQLSGHASTCAAICCSAAALSSGAEKRSSASEWHSRDKSSGQKDCSSSSSSSDSGKERKLQSVSKVSADKSVDCKLRWTCRTLAYPVQNLCRTRGELMHNSGCAVSRSCQRIWM
jgi:hypothetical protein